MVYCCVHFVTLKIIRRKASPKEKHIESKEKCCHLLYLSQAKKSMQKIKEVVKTKHAYLYVYICGRWVQHEVLFKETEQQAAVTYCPRPLY